jgi:hypothetical protein
VAGLTAVEDAEMVTIPETVELAGAVITTDGTFVLVTVIV